MIYRIRLLFASLCPVAGIVPKPGLVQLFPTLFAAVSRRESGCTVAGTTFQTECLLVAKELAVPPRQPSPLLSH